MKKLIIAAAFLFLVAAGTRSQVPGSLIAGREAFKNEDVIFHQIDEHTWVGTGHAMYNESIYLVEGEKKALLIDAGTKINQLDKIVASLTRKPVMLVATHVHPDHTGSAIADFPEIYINPADTVLIPQFMPDYKGKVKFLKDGEIIDLGGRKIDVVFTPAHTPGSTTFIDKAAGYGFSGDSFGSGNLLLSLDFPTLLATCRKMSAIMETNGIKTLYPGHYYGNNPETRKRVEDMITLSSDVLSGKVKGKENPGGMMGLNLVVNDYGVRINYNEKALKNMVNDNPQAVEKGPYTIYTIAPGIYHIEDATRERPAGNKTDEAGKTVSMNNCSDMYLVTGTKKALLIDLSNFIKYDTSAIRSLRSLVYERTGNRELLITITHRHGDHYGMLPAFRDDARAGFLLPGSEFRDMNIFPPERTKYFQENESIDLGGSFVINTTEVPGHTDHGTLFFVKGKNIVFTGDAIGSGSGVWLFSYDAFLTYEKGIQKLIDFIEDPANGIDLQKLVIYGGHYWQKGSTEKLTSRYIYDMLSLIKKIGEGSAEAIPTTTGMKYLDTNFRFGSATITWNSNDAARYAKSITK